MRSFLTSSLVVVVAVAWVACVGDDPGASGTSGPATGDRLGPCFSDKKCKEGLECREPELICLTPGEPVPPDAGSSSSGGSSSGGSSSGASSSGSNGDGSTVDGSSTDGGGGCAIDNAVGNGPACGAVGRCLPSVKVCCATPTGPTCKPTAPECTASNGKPFACDGKLACNGLYCCAALANPASTQPPLTCSSFLHLDNSGCVGNPCAENMLCRSVDDCTTGKPCVPTEVKLGEAPDTVVWGVCK
jgi:hypothetical protein